MNQEDRYTLKLNAARLYYLKKMTQMEITNLLNISRPTLIKLLREAQEEGIVRIEVCDVAGMTELRGLENQLKAFLGLRDVKIVNPDSDADDAIISAIGGGAAPYVEEYIGPGVRVGIGWGRTLEDFAINVGVSKAARKANFMPILGGPGSTGGANATMFPNILCERIAAKFPGSVIDYVYAPLFAEDKRTRDAYTCLPGTREVLEKYDALDVALVGVDGDAGHSTTLSMEKSISGAIPKDVKRGIAGNVCAHFYDEDGRLLLCGLMERIISITPAQLRKTPVVIGLAGGAHKTGSIIGGAKAGLFNVLVTDVYTANRILSRRG